MGSATFAYLKKVFTTEANQGKAVFTLFPGLCKGCGLCQKKCPESALNWSEKLGVYGTPTVTPDPELCKGCRICEQVCPDCAITIFRKGKEGERSSRSIKKLCLPESSKKGKENDAGVEKRDFRV